MSDDDLSMQFSDHELVTYCRIFMVHEPCERPCGECRRNPVTFGQLRQRGAGDE